jgi:hypothetical protein
MSALLPRITTQKYAMFCESLARYDAFDSSRVSRIAALITSALSNCSSTSRSMSTSSSAIQLSFRSSRLFRRYFDNDPHACSRLLMKLTISSTAAAICIAPPLIQPLLKKPAKRFVKLDHKKYKNASKRIAKLFNELKENSPIGETVLTNFDAKIIRAMEAYLLATQDINRNHHDYVDEDFRQFFLDINRFLKIYEFVDDSFTLYVTNTNDKIVKISISAWIPAAILRAV